MYWFHLIIKERLISICFVCYCLQCKKTFSPALCEREGSSLLPKTDTLHMATPPTNGATYPPYYYITSRFALTLRNVSFTNALCCNMSGTRGWVLRSYEFAFVVHRSKSRRVPSTCFCNSIFVYGQY